MNVAYINLKNGVAEYATLQEAFDAAVSGQGIHLMGPLALAEMVELKTGADVILDLGGFEITCEAATAIKVSNGKLTIQKGKVTAKGECFRVVGELGEANLVIKSSVTAVSTEDVVVYVRGKDIKKGMPHQASLYTAGTLISESTEYAAVQGNGTAAGGNVTVSDGYITSVNNIGIYHPQGGDLRILGGSITGTTAVYVKSGKLEISGGTLIATGEKKDFTENNNGGNDTGDALVIDTSDYPSGNPNVSVSGGTFMSTNGDDIGNYKASDSISAEPKNFVSGGTFSKAVPADMCATGFEPKANSAGTYSVKGAAHVVKSVDDYNKIQHSFIRAQLREEAKFIIEETEPGIYQVTKSPEGTDTPAILANILMFANRTERVLIERLNGTYERFNFEYTSHLPSSMVESETTVEDATEEVESEVETTPDAEEPTEETPAEEVTEE